MSCVEYSDGDNEDRTAEEYQNFAVDSARASKLEIVAQSTKRICKFKDIQKPKVLSTKQHVGVVVVTRSRGEIGLVGGYKGKTHDRTYQVTFFNGRMAFLSSKHLEIIGISLPEFDLFQAARDAMAGSSAAALGVIYHGVPSTLTRGINDWSFVPAVEGGHCSVMQKPFCSQEPSCSKINPLVHLGGLFLTEKTMPRHAHRLLPA